MDQWTLGRVVWRSFFLQSSWNYQGYQNLGAAASMMPALEKIYGRWTPDLTDALLRALEPFNTHPYMAGPIFGSLIRAEEIGLSGGYTPEKKDRFRKALTTAFAAIGDAFFWNALLPLTAVFGLLTAVSGDFYGVFVFLITYNLFHFFIRVYGFQVGRKKGIEAVVQFIDRLHLPAVTLHLRAVLAGALGLLSAFVVFGAAVQSGSHPNWLWIALLPAPAIILVSTLLKKGISVELILYVLAVVFIGGAFILD